MTDPFVVLSVGLFIGLVLGALLMWSWLVVRADARPGAVLGYRYIPADGSPEMVLHPDDVVTVRAERRWSHD